MQISRQQFQERAVTAYNVLDTSVTAASMVATAYGDSCGEHYGDAFHPIQTGAAVLHGLATTVALINTVDDRQRHNWFLHRHYMEDYADRSDDQLCANLVTTLTEAGKTAGYTVQATGHPIAGGVITLGFSALQLAVADRVINVPRW